MMNLKNSVKNGIMRVLNKEHIMEPDVTQTTTVNQTVQGQTASNASLQKAPSELDRVFSLLTNQVKLLAALDIRLTPVLHRMPASDNVTKPELSGHIADVTYVLESNNQSLSNLIEQLAV